MRTLLLTGAVVPVIGVLAGAVPAATVDVLAEADGSVWWNGLAFSIDSTGSTIRTTRSGATSIRNGVYEFDLGGLPEGITITGAILLLATSDLIGNTNSTAQVDAYALAGDGVVTASDHQNNTIGTMVATETVPAGTVAEGGLPPGTAVAFEVLDVSPLQAAYEDTGTGRLTLRTQTFNFVTFSVHSLETATAAVARPTLRVDYVPEPAGLLLLATGGMLALRHRPQGRPQSQRCRHGAYPST